MLPNNLDHHRYRTCECCTFFIRSELKLKPRENTVCLFLMWTIFPIELDINFKKICGGQWGGRDFIHPLCCQPHANDIPSQPYGVHDWHGVGSVGGWDKFPQSLTPTQFFKITIHFPLLKLSTSGTHSLHFHVVCISVQTLCTLFLHLVFMVI